MLNILWIPKNTHYLAEHFVQKKYNVEMDPGIKTNKSNKPKVKNPPTDTPRVFGSITQKSIFFVASLETKNQRDATYSFQFL